MPLVDLTLEEIDVLAYETLLEEQSPNSAKFTSARTKLFSALEEGKGKVRCECCEKWTPRETASFGVEDGIYLCSSCVADLEAASLDESRNPEGGPGDHYTHAC